MIPRLITRGVLAAIAGAAMAVVVSSSPSFAFTLSSPSVTEQGYQDRRSASLHTTAAITTGPIIITITILIITTITVIITTIALTTTYYHPITISLLLPSVLLPSLLLSTILT